MIRSVKKNDARQISEIYNYYVLNSVSTFEEIPVTVNEMINRITAIHPKFPWIVYEDNGKVKGYSYATNWKLRSAYKKSVEITVYIKTGEADKGIGTSLYKELIKQLTNMNFHALIGGIALPNDRSIALHEKLGFKKIGYFKEVGYKFDQWIDVGYWQLVIESESSA